MDVDGVMPTAQYPGGKGAASCGRPCRGGFGGARRIPKPLLDLDLGNIGCVLLSGCDLDTLSAFLVGRKLDRTLLWQERAEYKHAHIAEKLALLHGDKFHFLDLQSRVHVMPYCT